MAGTLSEPAVTPQATQAAAALQERIAIAGPGERIVVPAGTYVFQSGLCIQDKRDLDLIFQAGAYVLCDDPFEDVLKIINSRDVRLCGGCLRHRVLPQGQECQAAVVQLENSSNILLYRCELAGGGAIGVCADQCEELTIDQCRIHDNSLSAFAFTRCADVEIVHSVVEHNGGLVNYSDVDSLTMYGNRTAANEGYWESVYQQRRQHQELDRFIEAP